MSRVPFVLFSASLLILLGQDNQEPPPPTHAALPLPVTKTYDVGGSNRLEFTFSWKDTGTYGPIDEMYCSHRCRGRVHFLHSSCDASCDDNCTALHQRDEDAIFRADGTSNDDGRYTSLTAVAQAGARFGATTPITDLNYTVFGDLQGVFFDPKTNGSKYKINVKYAHFCAQTCATTTRKILGRIYEVNMAWKFYRETDVDGKMLRTNGPQGTTLFTKILIPEDKFTDVTNENCLCSIVQEDKQTGFVPGTPTTTGTTGGGIPTTGTTGTSGGTGSTGGVTGGSSGGNVDTGGIRLGQNPGGTLINGKNQETIGLDVHCDDMNSGELVCTNPFQQPFWINLQPGTTLDTDEDGIQDVVVIVLVRLQVPVEMQGPDGGTSLAKARLRLACLDMNKKEPTPATKFRIIPSRDPIVARLAKVANNSLVQGPDDQARIWIYTDAASYEQVEKRLIPAPGPGAYIKLLHEAKRAGAPLDASRYDGCFSPALLSAVDAPAKDMAWFASTLAQRDPSAAAQGAKAATAAWAQALTGDVKKETFATAAALVSALCSSGLEEAQKAGLSLLKAAPESARAGLATNNLAAAWRLAWSADAGVSADAKAMLETYNPLGKALYLNNMRR
jgi:hypothetical protein